MSHDVLLKVSDLCVNYGHIEALKDVDVEVRRGEICSIIGANGAGKSTFLKAVSALVKPLKGRIEFEGEELPKKPYKVVKKGVIHVPEGRRTFSGLTIEDNLLVGAYLSDKTKIKEDLERQYELFPILKERRNQFAGTLSGGEQQRIILARAILKDAPIVVLDEATAFADPENEVLIQKAFSALTQGKTVIMIAHRLSTVIGADKIIVLSNGSIAEEGSHQQLLEYNGLYARMWNDYTKAIQWKISSAKEVK